MSAAVDVGLHADDLDGDGVAGDANGGGSGGGGDGVSARTAALTASVIAFETASHTPSALPSGTSEFVVERLSPFCALLSEQMRAPARIVERSRIWVFRFVADVVRLRVSALRERDRAGAGAASLPCSGFVYYASCRRSGTGAAAAARCWELYQALLRFRTVDPFMELLLLMVDEVLPTGDFDFLVCTVAIVLDRCGGGSSQGAAALLQEVLPEYIGADLWPVLLASLFDETTTKATLERLRLLGALSESNHLCCSISVFVVTCVSVSRLLRGRSPLLLMGVEDVTRRLLESVRPDSLAEMVLDVLLDDFCEGIALDEVAEALSVRVADEARDQKERTLERSLVKARAEAMQLQEKLQQQVDATVRAEERVLSEAERRLEASAALEQSKAQVALLQAQLADALAAADEARAAEAAATAAAAAATATAVAAVAAMPEPATSTPDHAGNGNDEEPARAATPLVQRDEQAEAALQAERERARAHEADLQARLAASAAERDSVRGALGAAEARASALAEQLAESTSECAALREQIRELLASRDAEVARARAERDELQQRLARAVETVQAVALPAGDPASARVAQLQAVIEARTNELLEMQAVVAEAQASMRAAGAREREASDLLARVRELEEHNATLVRQADAAEAARTEAELGAQQKEQDFEVRLAEELRRAEAERDMAIVERDALIEALQGQVEQLSQQLDAAEAGLVPAPVADDDAGTDTGGIAHDTAAPAARASRSRGAGEPATDNDASLLSPGATSERLSAPSSPVRAAAVSASSPAIGADGAELLPTATVAPAAAAALAPATAASAAAASPRTGALDVPGVDGVVVVCGEELARKAAKLFVVIQDGRTNQRVLKTEVVSASMSPVRLPLPTGSLARQAHVVVTLMRKMRGLQADRVVSSGEFASGPSVALLADGAVGPLACLSRGSAVFLPTAREQE